MNRKGFTLIELLAVIVILSIIMIVAVPNVLSVISKQEKNAFVNDAKKLITMAKYKMAQDTDIDYPDANGLVYLEYDFINNGDIKGDSDGYDYSPTFSFVALSRDANGFVKYNVQLVSKTVDSYNGIGVTSEEALGKDSAIKEVGNRDLMVTDEDPTTKYRNIYKKIYGGYPGSGNSIEVWSKKGKTGYE